MFFPGTLHAHTDYSNFRLRDSTNTVQGLMDYAIELGHEVLAYTEHETISNAVDVEIAYDKVREAHPNFKVIRGNEIYLVRNDLTKETYDSQQDQFYHFILLARDAEGHKQIRELSTRAWMRSWMQGRMRRTPTYYKDLEDIIGKNSGHVIGLSACLGGCLPQQLLRYRKSQDPFLYKAILQKVEYFRQLFGKDNFYLELQPSIQEEQLYTNPELLKIGKQLNIPNIITLDAHYYNKDWAGIHQSFLNSQSGEREVAGFYSTAYMMDDAELRGYIQDYISEEDIQNMYSNILKIKNSCEDYTLRKPLKIPCLSWKKPAAKAHHDWSKEIPEIKNFAKSDFIGDKRLAEIIIGELESRPELCYAESYNEINGNLEMIRISSEKNKAYWSAYLLNIQKIIDTCWEAGSIVLPSRGSGGGFYLLFVLGIIQMNKLKEQTQLYPWRFLNPDRVSPLDIDFDISGLKREQVLNKFREVYGEDRVANVLTLGREKSKSAILTAARGLGVDVDEAQYLASMIPSDRGQIRSLQQCYYGDKENGFEPIKEFVREMDNNYPEVWEVAQKIEGLICRVGVHAGGVVFVDEPFTESTALMRAPDGTIITQFDLHRSEAVSLIKYDALSVEAADKIQICLELLCRYGYIEQKPTLRETYESTIGVYNLERDTPEMWKMVWEHKIQSLFQLEQMSGVQAIALTRPSSVDDLAVLNSVIRLMAQEKGGELPLNKFARFKKDISLWYKEMDNYGLTKEEQKLLSKYLKTSYGIAANQETFMQLVQVPECGGFDLNFADKLRKGVAKKEPSVYLECKKEYFKAVEEKGLSKNLCHYVWDVLVATSRGYGFNASHTLGYSIVALQEMNLAYKYPTIFWDCACLIVNSGGEQTEDNDNSKNYNKIAQALGKAKESGITILPPDINKSDFTFTPVVEENSIVYGLSGINKIGLSVIPDIINNRPYSSLADFIEKTSLNKAQIISLIKAGAFGEQEKNLREYISLTCDKKKRVTLQNFAGLIKYNLIPTGDEYKIPLWIYNFNKYIKQNCKIQGGYKFGTNEIEFLNSIELDNIYDNNFCIIEKNWDKIYKGYMGIFKDWIKNNQKVILDKLNNAIFQEDWVKYADGNNVSAWEMEALCYYYHDHELIKVNNSKYNLSVFDNLPLQPTIAKSFVKNGRTIPLFKILRIAGTVIAKDKLKSMVYILTPEDNVVPVKFNKEYFNLYDKQISQRNDEGKKKIIEKSWFKRGTKIVIQGFRRENQFIAKRYRATPGHTLYKITDIDSKGAITLVHERAKGEIEDSEEN